MDTATEIIISAVPEVAAAIEATVEQLLTLVLKLTDATKARLALDRISVARTNAEFEAVEAAKYPDQ